MKDLSRRLHPIPLLLLLVTLLLTQIACEPIADLKFKNETDQTLYIYVNPTNGLFKIGRVESGKEIKNKDAEEPIPYLNPVPIEIKDSDGKILYSKEFTWNELDKSDWTVTIPISFE